MICTRLSLITVFLLTFTLSLAQNHLKLTNINNGKIARIREGANIKFKVKTGDPRSFVAGVYHKGRIEIITDSMVVINGYGIPYYELSAIKKQSALRETGRIAGVALSPITLRIGMLFIGLGIQSVIVHDASLAVIGFGAGGILTAFSVTPYFLNARVYDLEHEWEIEPEYGYTGL